MKKFTKLFLSCAAVAALTAALATSAMAADELRGDIAGSYENGVLTLTAPDGAAATKTLLVLDNGADKTDIKAADILGIDQNAEITEVKLDASKINTEEKTYTVLMGGGDKIFVAEFGVKSQSLLMGDVDFSEEVDLDDALAVIQHSVKLAPLTGDALTAGDVDESEEVDLDDALCIIRYSVKFTTDIGLAGQTK